MSVSFFDCFKFQLTYLILTTVNKAVNHASLVLVIGLRANGSDIDATDGFPETF